MSMAIKLPEIPYRITSPGRLLALLCLTCMLAYAAPGLAGIYKWLDEQGRVQYGSEPPEGTEAERIKVKIPPPIKTAKPEKKEDADGEAQDGEEQKDEAKQPEQAAEPEPAKLSSADKARLCSNARARLQNAQTNSRLRVSDDKGSSRIISEQERQQRISQARKDVREFCR